MGVYKDQSQILYVAEGRNSSVAISRWNNGTILYVNVNGHVEATTEPFDMKLQRMVGQSAWRSSIPIRNRCSALASARAFRLKTFTRYPGIQKITVCEIEPVIPPASDRVISQRRITTSSTIRAPTSFATTRATIC